MHEKFLENYNLLSMIEPFSIFESFRFLLYLEASELALYPFYYSSSPALNLAVRILTSDSSILSIEIVPASIACKIP